MKRTTLTNLKLCFPEVDENKRILLAKKSIIGTFQTMAESGAAWIWPTEKVLANIVEVEGLEIMREAAAAGKGVVVLAPHLGNWEVLGLYLDNSGCGQCNYLYQAPKDKKMDKLIYNARSRAGANIVATDNKGVAMLLKSLKRGEIVGILPDQVPSAAGGEFASFFGKQALTMTLASRLIQKTGAKAVLGFAARLASDNKQGWKIIFQRPEEEIYAKHISTSLKAMNKSIETAVREFPDQYQWEYKRFRRVPDSEQRPY